MRTYVYTEYGEQKAKEYGITYRKAGSVATLAYKQFPQGWGASTANSWEAAGYIRPIEVSWDEYERIEKELAKSESEGKGSVQPVYPVMEACSEDV